MRKNLITHAGPLRSGCGLFTPPTCAPFGPLLLDIVAGLAQRLQFTEPEQAMITIVRDNMVRDSGQLL